MDENHNTNSNNKIILNKKLNNEIYFNESNKCNPSRKYRI
jgi:hypothetical protein